MNYYSTSRFLKNDISIEGRVNYKRFIWEIYTDLDETSERENFLLKEYNVVKDPSYYNKQTNITMRAWSK